MSLGMRLRTRVCFTRCPFAAVICFGSGTLVDQDKEEVTEYFNNNGFERWNKIYSESDEVNDVQRDIRTGHSETIDKVGLSISTRTSVLLII